MTGKTVDDQVVAFRIGERRKNKSEKKKKNAICKICVSQGRTGEKVEWVVCTELKSKKKKAF